MKYVICWEWQLDLLGVGLLEYGKIKIMEATKNKTTFTPGPWKHDISFFLYEKDRYSQIKGGIGVHPTDPKSGKGFTITGVMSDADARLIAAAPTMYELLKELAEDIDPEFEARIKKLLNKINL